MSEPRGLIFDCDGTLADTMPAHFQAWSITLQRHGLEFSERRFYELGGMPSHRIAALLAQEQKIPVDPEQIAHEKEEAFLEHVESVRPIEAVVAIAREHWGKVPLAVASGGFRPVIRRVLAHLEILDLFQTVVTAEDTVHHKPAPDVFLEAARRLGVPPMSCVVYEDTEIGLEAARRAGMRGIDVRPLY